MPEPRAYDARMSALAESFNRSSFGRWINSPTGRAFRATAGVSFLVGGLAARRRPGGKASLLWGVLPFTAGAFDVCYISAALGGPLRGSECRAEGARSAST